MALIVCLWLFLFLEIIRFISSVRSGVKSAKAQTGDKVTANFAGCLVVAAMCLVFGLTITVLIWTIVTLSSL